ncbi:MAG: hypothetical protein J0L87_05970 [Bacteroidetes bacterium]|nr:hypothetical protein [Bacteroidota bacterium]
MKNKKLLKFLIPFTILIWGYIGYKIYHAIDARDNYVLTSPVYQKKKMSVSLDTFSIKANYSDPFLAEIVKERRIIKMNSDQQTNSNIQKTSSNPQVNSRNLPIIQYYGVIKSTKTKKQIAIISLNGLIGNYSVGDQFSGVEVLRIYNDSILLRYNKDKFYIKK